MGKSEAKLTHELACQGEPLKPSVRLEIPLASVAPSAAHVVMMRRLAGVVHSLATEFDALSRRKDLSLELMSLNIRDAVNNANSEIQRVTATDKTGLRRHQLKESIWR